MLLFSGTSPRTPTSFIGIKEAKELHFYEVIFNYIQKYNILFYICFLDIKFEYLHFRKACPKGENFDEVRTSKAGKKVE